MSRYQVSAFVTTLEYSTNDLAAFIVNSGQDETQWEKSTIFNSILEEEIFKMSETISYSFQIARINNPPFLEADKVLPIENYENRSQIIIFENQKAVKIIMLDDLYKTYIGR